VKTKRNGNIEVVPVYAMKECGGRRGMALLILKVGNRQRWEVSFTLRPLYL